MLRLDKSLVLAAVTAALTLAGARPGAAQIPATALPEPDGTIHSSAVAVNASGKIVGYIVDTNNNEHPCAWENGALTMLTLPAGFDYGKAFAVNSRGEIADNYARSADGTVEHPVAWLINPNTSALEPVDLGLPEGETRGWCTAISDTGQVGCNMDNSKGYLAEVAWDTGSPVVTWTLLQLDDGTPVFPEVIRTAETPDGQITWIAGVAPNSSWPTGAVFWQRDEFGVTGQVITPSDSDWVSDVTMNSKGQIAGGYHNTYGVDAYMKDPSAGRRNLYLANQYYGTPLNGAFAMINDNGKILVMGEDTSYADRAWLEDNGYWTEIPVGELVPAGQTDQILAASLNNQEQVAGYLIGYYYDPVAFVWDVFTGFRMLGTLGGGAEAFAINDAGLVIGASAIAPGSASHACVWTAPLNHTPVLSVPNTVSIPLGNDATFHATATDPDEGDTVTFSLVDDIYGAAINTNTGEFLWLQPPTGNYAFTVAATDTGGLIDTKTVVVSVWPAGDATPVDLGTLEGYANSIATGVNASSMVVGYGFNTKVVTGPDGSTHSEPAEMVPFVWENGTMTKLGSLGDYAFCQAVAVNASGLIVGEASEFFNSGHTEVCVWQKVDGVWGPPQSLGYLTDPALNHNGSYLGWDNQVPINDLGQIVGVSRNETDPMGERGFIWESGTMNPLEDTSVVPPAPIYPLAINQNGQVLGLALYAGSEYGPEPVVWQSGTTTRLAPNSSAFRGTINNLGQVAGVLGEGRLSVLWLPAAIGTPGTPSYWDAGLNELFWLEGADIPAINDSGQFLVSARPYHLEQPGEAPSHLTMMSLSGAESNLGDTPPGEMYQVAMNAFGQVAGTVDVPYFDQNGDFLYSIAYGIYASPGIGDEGNRVFLLGGLGGLATVANAINDSGRIVGGSLQSDNVTVRACTWLAPVPENQPPVLKIPETVNGAVGAPVTFSALAFDVDPDDTFTFGLNYPPAGASIDPATGVFTWTPTEAGTFSVWVWVGDGHSHPTGRSVDVVVWPAGTPVPTDLTLPRGFENSTAVAINTSGQVIGECFKEVYLGADQDWYPVLIRACVWENGAPTVLPMLPTDTPYEQMSTAFDINNDGQIVGYCTDYYTYDYYGQPATGQFPQACLWQKDTDGKWTVTGLGFVGDDQWSVPRGMNSSGQVLVASGNYSGFAHNFIWQNGAQQLYSGLPEGYDTIEAVAINDSGVVIGYLHDSITGMNGAGVVWDPGNPPDTMPSVLKKFEGLEIDLFAINNSGWVTGDIFDTTAEQYRGFLWQPGTDTLTDLPFPPSDLPNPIERQTNATGINDDGTVLVVYYGNFDPDGVPDNDDDYFAVEFWAWKDGAYVGPIKSFQWPDRGGTYINSAGQVAGWVSMNDHIASAFFWPGASPAVDLPGLGGDRIVVGNDEALQAMGRDYSYSSPRAINSNGEIAGTSSLIPWPDAPLPEVTKHAVVWKTPQPNHKPTLDISTAPTTGTKGTAYAFTATANDPDGDALTFTLEGDNHGATIGETTGDFKWTPSATGTFTFMVKAADPGGAFDTKSFTVEVSRAPSVLDFSTATVTRKGKTVTVTIKTTVTNPTTTPALNAKVIDATLGTITTATALPLRIGTIRPHTSKTITMIFRNAPAGKATLTVEGTCSLGGTTYEFYTSQDVTVP